MLVCRLSVGLTCSSCQQTVNWNLSDYETNSKPSWYHCKIYSVLNFEGADTNRIFNHGNAEMFWNTSVEGTILLSDGSGFVVASDIRILTFAPCLCGDLGVIYGINWMTNSPGRGLTEKFVKNLHANAEFTCCDMGREVDWCTGRPSNKTGTIRRLSTYEI
jgi:hypothetical protein